MMGLSVSAFVDYMLVAFDDAVPLLYRMQTSVISKLFGLRGVSNVHQGEGDSDKSGRRLSGAAFGSTSYANKA